MATDLKAFLHVALARTPSMEDFVWERDAGRCESATRGQTKTYKRLEGAHHLQQRPACFPFETHLSFLLLHSHPSIQFQLQFPVNFSFLFPFYDLSCASQTSPFRLKTRLVYVSLLSSMIGAVCLLLDPFFSDFYLFYLFL